MNRCHFCFFTLSLLAAPVAWADVSLPPIFSEHMVLQRSAETPVWGDAAPGEVVEITLFKAGEACVQARATAGADGRWMAKLDLSVAALGGPYQFTAKAANEVALSDVLLGDVWLASGQSNMARLMRVSGSREEIAESANPQIRFFTIANIASPTPLPKVEGKWTVAGPEATPEFSAVAYYFARQINAEAGVPVGVIHASWGSTPVEAWTSEEALKSDAEVGRTAMVEIEAARNFPKVKAAWLSELKPWLAANQREDTQTPEAELAAYTTLPTDEGWAAVKLPGKLPGERILWVRRDVTLSQKEAGKPLMLRISEISGIDTVYFDGKRVGGRTLETYDGDGEKRFNVLREYTVPATEVTPGKHTVAVRIYAPLGASAIRGGYFFAGGQSLAGEWLMKTEKEFALLSDAAKASRPGPLKSPLRPWIVSAALYNGMIHGLIPYALRGVIWYQGESNANDGVRYRTTFPMLIQDWRKRWGKPELPFYWVQLANHRSKMDDPNAASGLALLREAQSLTLKLPHTGQAVIIDAGEAGDIHPMSKREPGTRLAAIALALDYGKVGEYSGPVFDSMTVEGSTIRIRFRHVGGGLVAQPVPAEYLYMSRRGITRPLKRNSPESELEGFAIRGAAGSKWHWASAHIEDDSVIVSSPQVSKPEAVRYGWASNPTCNLYNKEGFPASPFRTDAD